MTINPVTQMQAEATKDAIEARNAFEIEQQTRKVRSLAEQCRLRLDVLSERVSEVARAVSVAEEGALHYTVGAFGHDTETIDALLSTLSEESASLDNMRAARDKGLELQAKYDGKIDALLAEAEASAHEKRDQPGLAVVGGPGGGYL